ncbi:MAG: metal-binding protein, partial [Euryarchaeota archaeon]|nr:metal-binding protein [Euryarchaeota archaeon]
MPGYNVHRLFNYTVFIAIIVVLCVRDKTLINLKMLLALGAGFYIGTDFITPDLDIDSSAIKKWGRLKIIVLPYKWMFTHRQSSHNIVYGALIRILYISLIVLGLYYLLFSSLPESTILSVYVFIFLIGIIIANAL